jgi:hypothetical protein
MLKNIAAALVAATMLTAPVLVAGANAAPVTTTGTQAAPAKPAAKSVMKHRRHVRHVVRAKAKHMKVARHGKVAHFKGHQGWRRLTAAPRGQVRDPGARNRQRASPPTPGRRRRPVARPASRLLRALRATLGGLRREERA